MVHLPSRSSGAKTSEVLRGSEGEATPSGRAIDKRKESGMTSIVFWSIERKRDNEHVMVRP